MENRSRHIRIFASSPSDVKDERTELKTVVEELGTSFSRRGVTLELLTWETHSYPSAESPQVAINRQIGSYDIFIGIMWKRFGTPTDTAGSGTEEEFRIAYKLWEQDKRRPVLYYFKDKPFTPTMEDLAQVARVLGFRQELTTARKAFVWSYPTAERPDFASHVRPQLTKAIDDYLLALEAGEQEDSGADGAGTAAAAPAPRLPSTLFAVYIADYFGQPEYLREEILERLCERRGVSAETIPVIDEAELKQRDPSHPTVSIHLFDGTCGDREYDLLQLGRKHAAWQIVWAPRALDLSQPLNGRTALRDLADGDGSGRAHHLTRLPARDSAEDIVARAVKFEQQWRLTHARCVLLDVNRKDTVRVKPLIEYMDSHRIQRANRPYDEPDSLINFDDALVRSKVLIFVSGQVGQDYVRRRLLKALNLVAPLKHKVHRVAVYGAPPERQPRDAWRFDLPFPMTIKFIDNTTGFDPSEVSELLADVMEAERHEAAS